MIKGGSKIVLKYCINEIKNKITKVKYRNNEKSFVENRKMNYITTKS